MIESQFVADRIDLDEFAFFEFTVEDLYRQRILNHSLDRAFERARSVGWIVAFFCDECLGSLAELKRDLTMREILPQSLKLYFYN